MKLTKVILAVCVLFSTLFINTVSYAASYDIKETSPVKATWADTVAIRADKVMNGITDVSITMTSNKEDISQRIVLQCDSTTQTINVFYYLNDVLGGKAANATGFSINAYGSGDEGYKHGGDAVVFDGLNTKQNLRERLQTLKALDGKGFISFELYENKNGIDKNPVAHSFLIGSFYGEQILNAVESIQGSEGCNINGGFTAVYTLKNLNDQI